MFWFLHIMAVVVFPLALFITIPFHIFVSKSGGGQG